MSREGRRELQTAIDFFRKAIDSDPESAIGYIILIRYFDNKDDFDAQISLIAKPINIKKAILGVTTKANR